MNQPFVLKGSVVTLRDFTPQDVDAALQIVGDDRVTQWLSFDSRDRAGAERMVAAAVASTVVMPRTEYYLAVTAGGELVGFVRLALGGVKAAKLGYAIHADHWGNGYATDAARTIVRLGFDELGLHRITAAVGPTNHASMTVLTHLGFAREGTLREHVFTGGRWRDSVLFSLLEHERTPH